MIGKAALERLRGVEVGMISDCMMRLGLSGWMDGVRPVQQGLRRAVNDVSRGCSAQDLADVGVITAVQALALGTGA